jgi:hypothetical protein
MTTSLLEFVNDSMVETSSTIGYTSINYVWKGLRPLTD